MRAAHLLVLPLALSALACGGSSPPPTAPTGPCPQAPADGLEGKTKEELARMLMDLTGVRQMSAQIMDAMAQKLSQIPSMPLGFMERFTANADPNELVELIVPIYVKEYDQPTLVGAVRFYRSPPGHDLVAKLPVVTQESIAAGQDWGKRLAEKTLAQMGIAPSPGAKGRKP